MQRGVRFVLHRSAPMQRGAHFSILDIPFRAPCWAQARRPKRFKINAFLLILKTKGAPGAATKWSPKSKKCKIYRENECFFANALGALWRPRWIITFLSPHPGASTWLPLTSRNILKRNVFLLILNIKGAPGPATKWSPRSKKCKIYLEK